MAIATHFYTNCIDFKWTIFSSNHFLPITQLLTMSATQQVFLWAIMGWWKDNSAIGNLRFLHAWQHNLLHRWMGAQHSPGRGGSQHWLSRGDPSRGANFGWCAVEHFPHCMHPAVALMVRQGPMRRSLQMLASCAQVTGSCSVLLGTT